MSVCEKNVRDKYRRLTKQLIVHSLTITTMESATAGQLASLITDTEGSSAVMKGAFITYSNEAKILMGVPAKVIEKYSVYSVQTAKAMAERCAAVYAADIGIGVTGTMGNIDPANEADSVPGRIFYAITYKGKTISRVREIPPEKTRLLYKLAVADMVVDEVFSLLAPLF